MIWKLAAPLRVVIGVIRDEVAVQRLQRSDTRLRQAIPGYSDEQIDRELRHAAYMRRRLRRNTPLSNTQSHAHRLARFF
jgi:hypothetical protein